VARAAVAAALLLSGCATTYVTPIGPQRPSRPEGCALDLFNEAAAPPYPTTPIAKVRTECDPVRRNVCTQQLRTAACVAGADAIVGIKESMFEYSMYVDATFVAKEGPLAAPTSAAPIACNPICSPGFACQAGRCVPQCNPPCESGEICNRQRVCEPAAPPPNQESESPQVIP
jgi:hypothetical protein